MNVFTDILFYKGRERWGGKKQQDGEGVRDVNKMEGERRGREGT